ncbi:AbrB/MazE/SpoVT family DNA-binding domain-containing protein [Acidianus sulfidivorans JP7]|uniref:Phosphate uptake regulator PhoU n=1 Tax=Acidianus sulfidivorans JP7 TaxID=619593 RepID=A0A2U9ING0_9CREN|nr:phosphate uptake regulator PhoU [Acidianus sulfidivorans]AWR97568.1 AbrB/MazE/SpoVT family DNA-binding domain-containing protein [Acidianus sulfidivorans JP7]
MPASITRKIQLTGGSTYIISLPKNWVKQLSLKPGDEVEILQDNNLKLIIIPRGKELENRQNKGIITCENAIPSFALREFIAYYMAGYTTVSFICNKMKAEDRAIIKDSIRKRLLGAEVVEEDANNITVQFLVNEKDLPISKAISRAASISQNMVKDSIEALKTKDYEIAQEIIERDDEVDRFYFYVARQLTLSVSSFEILEEEGYNITQLVDIHAVIKSIERISDHASRIASLIKDLKDADTNVLSELGLVSLESFKESFEAFVKQNRELANKIIQKDQEIGELHKNISKEILAKPSEYNTSLLLIADSFRRIGRYSVDIAENTINIMAKRLEKM